LLIFILFFYKKYKYEDYADPNIQMAFTPRKFIGNAECIKDDISLTRSEFQCIMNKKYSPVNINVSVIKYQNFAPYIPPTFPPETSFSLMSSLTPSLTPAPLFSDTDFNLIGTTTNPITSYVTLNDYTKLMKVISYPNSNLFDDLSNPKTETASLDNNNFLYLPDCIVPYLKYLNDLGILQTFIDKNKINSKLDIATQFHSYLSGFLISYDKPNDAFRLDREIMVITSSDKKNIVNIQFNQTITTINDVRKTSFNINTDYNYLIVNSYLEYMVYNSDNTNFIKSIINVVNRYGNYLKIRKIIDQQDIDNLIDKINNIDFNKYIYINYYYTDEDNFGIQLVKRVDGTIIYLNYFEQPFIYYKNICPDPANNYYYEGRCYSNCPNGYSSLGLSCVINDEKSRYEINKLFNPNSIFCKEICKISNKDINIVDSSIQKACWCKSVSCDTCTNFNIDNCNC